MFTSLVNIFLPIVLSATVTGHTFTYTEGATCVIKQNGVKQTVTSDSDLWCSYTLTPNQSFTVEITEVSDNPQLPGPVWGFTCKATDVSEEYPQATYGAGCKRS